MITVDIAVWSFEGPVSNSDIYSKQPGCKKRCHPIQNGQCEKSCEIKGGGQEMAVMVCIDSKNFNNNNSGKFCAVF